MHKTLHTLNVFWCFADIISLDADASSPSGRSLDETGISVKSDREDMFKQVKGFDSATVEDTSVSCASVGLKEGCKSYTDPSTGQSYLYYYPDDDTVQYLHESYPDQISPIVGVKDEHFIVWMRTASLPTFRKLYGTLTHAACRCACLWGCLLPYSTVLETYGARDSSAVRIRSSHR
jgi:hypothetical protein